MLKYSQHRKEILLRVLKVHVEIFSVLEREEPVEGMRYSRNYFHRFFDLRSLISDSLDNYSSGLIFRLKFNERVCMRSFDKLNAAVQ